MARKGTSKRIVGAKRSEDPKSSDVQGCVAIRTSNDGKVLYSEATISTEGRKRFANVWLLDSAATKMVSQPEAPEVCRSTRERRPPAWHSEYVIESNVAYCLLTKHGEPSTLHETTSGSDASL